jgi:hypothetical protein
MRYCLDHVQPEREDPWVFEQTWIERTRYEETIALAGDASDERSTQVARPGVLEQVCRAGHHPVVIPDAHEVAVISVNDYYAANFAIWSDNGENGNGRFARLHSFGATGTAPAGIAPTVVTSSRHTMPASATVLILISICLHLRSSFLKPISVGCYQIKIALFEALYVQCRTREIQRESQWLCLTIVRQCV